MPKIDGHIHSPYCPHGSKDPLEDYVNRAVALGFEQITFTEHAPLPNGFTDPVPEKDSAMASADLCAYFDSIRQLKKKYEDQITILSGLEVDFIEGFEHETDSLLASLEHHLDEVVLSVHFLKMPSGEYLCMDFDEETYREAKQQLGGLKALYETYYRTVRMSIDTDWSASLPMRVGHISLVHKFQAAFQRDFDDSKDLKDILNRIKNRGYMLDVNGAGLVKPLCKETYPPPAIIEAANQLRIPLVYGSDAHSALGIGQGYDTIEPLLTWSGDCHHRNQDK